MSALVSRSRLSLAAIAVLAVCLTGCAGWMGNSKPVLTGAQEVPPVDTQATAVAEIKIGPDKSVTGFVTTSGIVGVAAHIHEAPVGVNGPVIVPLTKTSQNVWTVPDGAVLTDAQYTSYLAGNLYVNVHSAEHKGGEIRTQLKP